MTSTKIDNYRLVLRNIDNWDSFLLQNSGLPGKRVNIELGFAIALEGDEDIFNHLLTFVPEIAPTNSPQEFLAFCGVLGLGTLLSNGRTDVLESLRKFANDRRWRIREAVAMALQMWGKINMDALINEMMKWTTWCNWFEKRA